MNTKQRVWVFEKRKPAVGAKGFQTSTGQQTQPSPTAPAPYNIVNANLRKFGGIFRYDADFAVMQCAHEHVTERMGS